MVCVKIAMRARRKVKIVKLYRKRYIFWVFE